MLKTKGIIAVIALLLSLNAGAQSSDVEIEPASSLAPPKNSAVDRFGVDLSSNTVTASLTDLQIGGEMGLSHSISTRGGVFTNYGVSELLGTNRRFYGFADSYRGGLYTAMHSNLDPGAVGTQGHFFVLRAWGMDFGADFVMEVDASGDISYRPLEDERYSLEYSDADTAYYLYTPSGTRMTFPSPEKVASPSSQPTRGAFFAWLSEIRQPNGLLITIEGRDGTPVTAFNPIGRVTTNTGYQLNYLYARAGSNGWDTQAPQCIVAINLNETTFHPSYRCPDPDNFVAPSLPTTTYQWPSGMPFADGMFAVIDSTGRRTEYQHTTFESDEGGQTSTITSIKNADSEDENIVYTMQPIYKTVTNTRVSYAHTMATATVGTFENTYSPPGQGNSGAHQVTYSSRANIQGGIVSARTNTMTGQRMLINAWDSMVYFNQDHSFSRNDYIVTAYDNSVSRVVHLLGGGETWYDYDSRGNLVSVLNDGASDGQRDNSAPETTAVYASSCNSPHQNNSNYTWCNQPSSVTDANGNLTQFTYHHSGQLASVRYPAIDSYDQLEIRYGYTQYSTDFLNGVSGNDGIWLKTQESYCTSGRFTSTNGGVNDSCSNGDKFTINYEYNHPNRLLTSSVVVADNAVGQQEQRRSCYYYDGQGRQIGETLPKANLTSCPQNPPTGGAAYHNATRYNVLGQVTGTISADPDGSGSLPYIATRNTYDSYGRLLTTETGTLNAWQGADVDPADWTGFSLSNRLRNAYNSRGLKTVEQVTASNGENISYKATAYDGQNRVACEAVRMSNNAIFYSEFGAYNGCEQSHPTNPFQIDRITRYHYNDHFDGNYAGDEGPGKGQLSKVERGVGTDLQQVYQHYKYDVYSRKISVTDANGNLTAYDYDDNNRLYTTYFPEKGTPLGADRDLTDPVEGASSSSDYERYTYDANGNRTHLRKRDGRTIRYDYDGRNRVERKYYQSGYGNILADLTVNYQYDNRNLLLSALYENSGDGNIHQYSGFGELKTEQSRLGSTTYTLNYRYDKHGNRTRITYPGNLSFDYRYDSLDRVTGILSGSSVLIDGTYDNFGRPESRTTLGGAQTNFAFDSASRLTELGLDFNGSGSDLTMSYGYNLSSQMTYHRLSNESYYDRNNQSAGGGYEINGLNQYTSVDGVAFTYDDNGNMTRDQHRSYGYDIENRLITAGTAQLTYDPAGRLTTYRINGNTTRFVYSGDALIAEYRNGSVAKRYVHGVGLDVPLVQFEGSLTSTFYAKYLHANHQGSIIANSNSSGNVINNGINTYNEFGVPSQSNYGRFGYTGQMYLEELGLYHYKARVYHPEIGRFLQTDPVGYEDQMNLYAYVHNDPLTYVDPTGEFTFLSAGIGAVVGAVAGGVTQVITDVASGNGVSYSSTVGAIAGGAVTGAIIGGTGNVAAGVTVGSAVSSMTSQVLDTGSIDATQTVADVAVGATVGKVVPGLKVPGVTSGKGSFQAVAKSTMTKLSNGTIKNVSAKTIGKMVGAEVVGGAAQAASGALSNELGAADMVDKGLEEIKDVATQ